MTNRHPSSIAKTPKLDFHRYEPRSRQHFRRLFAAIQAYLDDLDRGQYVFRPGMGCSICEYRDDCCQRWNASAAASRRASNIE